MAGFFNAYQYAYTELVSGANPLGLSSESIGYLHRLVLNVADPANSDVTLSDGASSIQLQTASATNATGVISIEVNALSRGGQWVVTLGAGVSGMAVGVFN